MNNAVPTVCIICKEGKNIRHKRNFFRQSKEYSFYECATCKVQFWFPQEIADREWYEHVNPYKARQLGGIKLRGYHKLFLKKYASLPKDAKILDLGCGVGEFLFELKKGGYEVFGMDFDRDAIKIAKNQFGLENVFALSFEEFCQKSDLPKFDVITFFEVIEHLADPAAFIKNIKNLLKPGGKIILSTPSRKRMLPNLNSWDFPPHHFTRWDATSLSNIFSRFGFSVQSVSYVEQFKVLRESVLGKLTTGLVLKSVSGSSLQKRSMLVPKAIYFLGRVKSLILGTIPASILWIFGKITGRENGIIFVEFAIGEPDKKVIFFAPILDKGGMERVVSELSLNLPGTIEVMIVLFANQAFYPYNFKGKIISLELPSNNTLPLKVYYFFAAIARFKKILKKEKPDHVVSFGFHPNIINIIAFKKSIIRADVYLSASLSLWEKLLAKFFFRKSSKAVCVSRAVAKDLTDHFNVRIDKIKVIYNPLNIKEIQKLSLEPVNLEYEAIFQKPTIITMGRFSEQKGQWHLIRVFKEVKKTIKDAKLVILGTGKLEDDLKKLITSMGLQSEVYLLGWQSNPFAFLAKSKVFVLSSLYEGLSYVLLEAMTCGLPVVSVDCKSGPREILAPNTNVTKEAVDIEFAEYGILTSALERLASWEQPFLTKAEEKLKQAIVRMLSDAELAGGFSVKSKQRAEQFDVKNIIKEWEFLGE